jgi:hypothetical protein
MCGRLVVREFVYVNVTREFMGGKKLTITHNKLFM